MQAVYRAHEGSGPRSDLVVMPAMAFYGGLADLLATAAVAEWGSVDGITVAVGLDRWWPTTGTRLTGRRNTATRLVVDGGRLVPAPDPAPVRDWEFADPLGRQQVVGNPFSEIITISRHLNASRIHTYLATVALDDLRNPETPVPPAADASKRPAQHFVVDVVARRDAKERRISASGRDIYAVTAPLVVEAAERILDGRTGLRGGVAAPGEAFDAADFLDSLSPRHLRIRRP